MLGTLRFAQLRNEIHNKENAVTTITKIFFVCLCLSFAFPAIVCAGDVKPSAEQKRVAETFITALQGSDFKTAYSFFNADVRGKYPFPVFVDIQQKVNKTIGSLTSYTYKSVRKSDDPPKKDTVLPSNTYVYELYYQKETQKTTIPLELIFGSGDSVGQMLSYKYVKDQMRNGEKK